MEKLLTSSPLAGQRPTELLADLTQYCPEGETAMKIFRLLFLHRLPRELRIILSEDTTSTLAALAARADQLWSHCPSTSMHAVADDPADTLAVAAISSNSRGGSRGSGQWQRGRGEARGGNRGGRTANSDTGDGAKAASGLCHYHWKFGDQAYTCKAPCTWQEN
jgi:hypothetical protein